MKVLVIISHYFKSEANGIYSSTNASLRDIRKQTLEKVLLFWRSHYDENSIINIDKKKLVINRSCVDQLDLVLLIHEDNHLIDDNIIKTYGLKTIKVKTDNPRMIPFAAQKVMAELSNSYEWFIYSEDDLAIHDSLLFHKLTLFQNKFGFTRLLQPNRFEINKSALKFKTYVDGDLKDGFIKPFLEKNNEQSNTLTLKNQGGFDIHFLRALNPHSGFFALTAEQLKHWMAQKHFMDLDCSFVSPLESGATLGILKTFSIYKSTVPNLGYFEIEHLDKKFSNMKLDVLLS